MSKKLLIIIAIFIFGLSLIPSVSAHCPLCTVAVGAAAVSAKYYGLDTSIIGLLMGAFGVSTGLWIGLKIKKEYFKFQFTIILFTSFLLTVAPLLYISNDAVYLPLLIFGSSGSFLNKVYWINKIFLGSLIGALITLVTLLVHIYIKKINGKVLFPYQGVAITLVFLFLSSIGLHFVFGG